MNALLLRLDLRRTRLRLVLWPLATLLVAASGASAYRQLYPTAAERAHLATAMDIPALRAIYGRAADLSTAGAFAFWRYGVFLAILVGLFAVLTVVKLTRAEEEAGRRELVWSGALPRTVPLASAMTVAGLGCVLIGLLGALGLAADAAGPGAVLFGAAVAGVGLVFVGVGALAALFATTARAAAGLGGTVLAVAYALRAMADSAPSRSWASWLSPIGWLQRTGAYTANDSAPLLGLFGAAAVLIAAALLAERNRDLLSGLLGVRPGPPRSRWLRTPEALAARLQMGTLTAWTIGLLAFGAAFGGLAADIGSVLREGGGGGNEILTRLGGSNDLKLAFLGTILQLAGALVVAAGVLGVLTAQREELGLRAEPLLARRSGRSRWLGSHLLVAAAGTVVAAAGMGAATAGSAAAAGVSGLPEIFAAGLNTLPVAALFIGLTTLAIAITPRQAGPIGLGLFGVAYAVQLFGALLNLPDTVLELSPFHHVALMPAESFDPVSAGVLTGVGVLLAAVGLLAVRRRDVLTAGA